MTKSIKYVLKLAVAAAILFLGCGDDWISGGESAGVNEFLQYFRENLNSGDQECSGFTLTVNINPQTGGTTSLSEGICYSLGTVVNITATRKADYVFCGWSGASTSRDSAITVIMNNNQTLTANFGQVTTDTFVDTRGDGQSYRTIRVCNLTWMAENLNYQTTDSSWCYDDETSNCVKYGRLYAWNTAMTACPAGWRLPDTLDWNKLVSAAGDISLAGTKLKSTSGWDNRSDGSSGNGTDDFGFSAMPGGLRMHNAWCSPSEWVDCDEFEFTNIGRQVAWWSATELVTGNVYTRSMTSNGSDVYDSFTDKNNGRSVRCVRDN